MAANSLYDKVQRLQEGLENTSESDRPPLSEHFTTLSMLMTDHMRRSDDERRKVTEGIGEIKESVCRVCDRVEEHNGRIERLEKWDSDHDKAIKGLSRHKDKLVYGFAGISSGAGLIWLTMRMLKELNPG